MLISYDIMSTRSHVDVTWLTVINNNMNQLGLDGCYARNRHLDSCIKKMVMFQRSIILGTNL